MPHARTFVSAGCEAVRRPAGQRRPELVGMARFQASVKVPSLTELSDDAQMIFVCK